MFSSSKAPDDDDDGLLPRSFLRRPPPQQGYAAGRGRGRGGRARGRGRGARGGGPVASPTEISSSSLPPQRHMYASSPDPFVVAVNRDIHFYRTDDLQYSHSVVNRAGVTSPEFFGACRLSEDTLAVGCWYGTRDILLIDIPSAMIKGSMRGSTSSVNRLCLVRRPGDPESTLLASTCNSGILALWDWRAAEVKIQGSGMGGLVRHLHSISDPVRRRAAASDGSKRGSNLRLWEAYEGLEVAKLKDDEVKGRGSLRTIAYHEARGMICGGSDASFVNAFDVETQKFLFRCPLPARCVYGLVDRPSCLVAVTYYDNAYVIGLDTNRIEMTVSLGGHNGQGAICLRNNLHDVFVLCSGGVVKHYDLRILRCSKTGGGGGSHSMTFVKEFQPHVEANTWGAMEMVDDVSAVSAIGASKVVRWTVSGKTVAKSEKSGQSHGLCSFGEQFVLPWETPEVIDDGLLERLSFGGFWSCAKMSVKLSNPLEFAMFRSLLRS